MKIRTLSLFAVLSIILSVSAQSISEDRRINWSNAGVEGGIPTVCNENAIFDSQISVAQAMVSQITRLL